MSYTNLREEELKNRIGEVYFVDFDYKTIIGNIDFCVTTPKEFGEIESLLWAEAKKGSSDIYKSIVQLILTIGKARTFDKTLPPAYLGAFDAEKIAFIPYNDIQEIFYQNDFNWNVAPSNYESKEFKIIYDKVTSILEQNTLLYFYGKDDKELKKFIENNFIAGKFGITKTRIDKNNFIVIYNKWLQTVKPTIAVNWDLVKKVGIIEADFYLADLLSIENKTLKEKLFVLLEREYYELDRKIDEWGMFNSRKITFKDNLKAHTQFWNKYERPPKEEYWDYIINRRDLLVPQDVRERKGSFFTPQIWVELSQKYLTDVLGENWQDEYYIWDCAAGTGNLLTGLTNKRNIWASTLDKQDVDVMHDRIKNGANLLENHVFQFDFLNDSFDKLPKGLQEIINSPEKRKKLVIYINPPYAEHGTMSAIFARGKAKTGVANTTKVYQEFNTIVGTATRELFAQFFLRVYKDIPEVKLASFSTLKFVNSQNFLKFRQYFKADFKKGFICQSTSFDNVKGRFPIGFLIWDLSNKKDITKVQTDIMISNDTVKSLTKNIKSFYAYGSNDFISSWLRKFYDKTNDKIAYLILPGVDMQCQNGVYITSKPTESDVKQHKTTIITKKNITEMLIYLSVRQCIAAFWTNNRDQFLFPNKKWEKNKEFHNDCLAFALFHGQNKISSKAGTNHFIPFTEDEVNAGDNFESNFMAKFIAGKIQDEDSSEIFKKKKSSKIEPLIFSEEAQAVFESGKKLWKYYHETINHLEYWMPKGEVNASLYDIREYFQERNTTGRMNSKSADEIYTKLIDELRESLDILAKKIEPKVYEYGFLKE